MPGTSVIFAEMGYGLLYCCEAPQIADSRCILPLQKSVWEVKASGTQFVKLVGAWFSSLVLTGVLEDRLQRPAGRGPHILLLPHVRRLTGG